MHKLKFADVAVVFFFIFVAYYQLLTWMVGLPIQRISPPVRKLLSCTHPPRKSPYLK